MQVYLLVSDNLNAELCPYLRSVSSNQKKKIVGSSTVPTKKITIVEMSFGGFSIAFFDVLSFDGSYQVHLVVVVVVVVLVDEVIEVVEEEGSEEGLGAGEADAEVCACVICLHRDL